VGFFVGSSSLARQRLAANYQTNGAVQAALRGRLLIRTKDLRPSAAASDVFVLVVGHHGKLSPAGTSARSERLSTTSQFHLSEPARPAGLQMQVLAPKPIHDTIFAKKATHFSGSHSPVAQGGAGWIASVAFTAITAVATDQNPRSLTWVIDFAEGGGGGSCSAPLNSKRGTDGRGPRIVVENKLKPSKGSTFSGIKHCAARVLPWWRRISNTVPSLQHVRHPENEKCQKVIPPPNQRRN